MAWISPEVAAALAKSTVHLGLLGEFRFVSGTMYLWNGVGARTIGGHTYEGLGTLASVDGLTQTRSNESEKVTVKMACVTPEIAALAASESAEVRGRMAFLSLHLFDADWQPVNSPIPAYGGIMQRLQIVREPASSEGGGARMAELEIENFFAARSRPSNGLYTDRHQKAKHSGDNFCRWVPKQKNQVQTWPDF